MSSRYDRQLPLVGEEGMKRITNATVGVIGCGGLGTHVITALSSAGIGKLVIFDGDSPDITNLNRQFVYHEGQNGKKADIMRYWIMSVNPSVKVEVHAELLTDSNASMLSECDILVDCLDNMESRKVLNRYAVKSGKTLIHGGVASMCGQVTVVIPGKTPCLECIISDRKREINPTISAAVAFIGSIEAMEVLKIIAGMGEPLAGKILTVDLGNNVFEVTDICKRPSCKVCGHL
ncbi:MAG: HesA/MoeB/ThiF family protein [Candidatus Methanogranum gryphiswaldense]|nr:MAG: HesA/MoeB/ThiF family protein [Candidatus Methanogranum sp. U3.2.1]